MDPINIGQFATWAWKAFGDDAKDSFLSFLRVKWKQAKEENIKLLYLEASWKGYNWDKAAEEYKKHMQVLYGLIRIIGMNEPVEIRDVFTDVYVLDKPQAYRRFDITLLHQLQEEPERLTDTERIRGLSVVIQKRGHRLYILGKPGAGKTTFLKYLVFKTIEYPELNKIPIFITLKDWTSSGLGLMDFIVKQFEICHFPNAATFLEYLLESGKAIVLFDGLDEVPQEDNSRDKITVELHNFSKKYLSTQVIITCRIAASDYMFSEFTYVEMADFNEAQVRNYAFNWFRNNPKKTELFLKELYREENNNIRDLGRSPLLLSMICLAYDETFTVPKRRVELYEEALDALLKKWDSTKNIHRDAIYQNLSVKEKNLMFARVAANHFEKGEIFFTQKKLSKEIEKIINEIRNPDTNNLPDGDSILQAIEAQHGIFSQRAQGLYSFAHLTFQEYYTAKSIVENSRYKRLPQRISDSRWREVFLLVASLLEEADDFIFRMQKEANKLIQNDASLIKIQNYVEERAFSIDGYTPAAVRAFYYSLILDINRVIDHALTNSQASSYVSYALDLVAALDEHIILDHAINPDFVLDTSISRAFNTEVEHHRQYRDEELKSAIDNKLTIADRFIRIQNHLYNSGHGSLKIFRDLNLALILQIAKYFSLARTSFDITPLLPKLTKYFNDAKNPSLHSEIQWLLSNVPPKYSTPDDWYHYFEKLRDAITKHTNIGLHLNLSIKQQKNLGDYIKANQLILDSLRVANVKDRRKVIDNILRIR